MSETADPDTIINHKGDAWLLREDTEEPGIMLDIYYNKPKPGPLDQAVNELVGHEENGDADNWLIIPDSVVRSLGKRLIAWADKHEAEWKQEREANQ